MMGLEDGFGVLDKATKQGSSSSSSEAGDLGGGKKLQSSKSLQQMMMTTMMGHHRDNLHRPFLDPPHDFGSGPSGYGDGPTTCTSSSSRPKISNIYDVVATSGSSAAASASVGATTFDISAANSEISHVTALKSPAGGMAASLEFPFTSSQWKELQRQALIFKYMMASLPVPPDLLFPTIRNPSVAAASHCSLGSGLNLGFSSRGIGDLEPGRCRRTDGKKWRCSRDVAPGQKYCERHMHRGRPRSRKPVELPNKKSRQSHTQDLPSSPSTLVLPNSCITANASQSPLLGSISEPFHQIQTTEFPGELSQKSATFGSMVSIASYKEPSLDWIMDRESVSMASSHQQLQHLIQQTKIEQPNNFPLLNQTCSQEPLSLNSYVDFGKDQEINNCHLILNPAMVPMGGKPHGNPGRSFIDAWSSDGHNANPGTKTDEKLSLSPLSLSMGGSTIIDDEMVHIHMGLGVTDSDQNQESGAKPHLSNWLAPASWTAPTPGGPLAEVLRPSKVAHATTKTTETSSKPLSPTAKNDDPCSPSVNAMSSPSGVLHRTLASMSDSSGSTSPTLTSSRAKPEISFLWLSQGKSASSN
ncbi:hypothetical protein SLEP1_g34946 [Rubroshorea leprosula]|uniref:Growth-regulating factor n=1 Tax=Rubroshorea leprosula TaxID=152421 RepID=A0AAV5KLL2_9ROSI|nr:hypothetical protein SLEP1_g34946 [Rubroshorea leprosula]